MATWKKLVVSGSAISQLTNDSGYISASQIPAGYNAFSTASYNGVPLIAAMSGTLTFASSSGQGLTISANAGTDTLTWGLSSIPTGSLEKSGSTIGSTFVGLGSTVTTITGLSSVTSTNFTGTASYATLAPSYVLTSATSSMVVASATSASRALSASNADLLDNLNAAAFVLNSQTSSMSVSSSLWAVSASQAINTDTLDGLHAVSFVLNSQTSSMSVTSALTASNITPAITNTTNNRVLTDNGGGTINGEVNLTFDGSTLVLNGSQTISGDLTVNGTTTTINTQNLNVSDKFILLSSGSTSANDGGIIIQSAIAGTGYAFLYDSAQARWAFTGSLSGLATTAAPDAFVATVIDLNVAESTDIAAYQKPGNIKIAVNQDIFIWS
jgi:hypothetical protein